MTSSNARAASRALTARAREAIARDMARSSIGRALAPRERPLSRESPETARDRASRSETHRVRPPSTRAGDAEDDEDARDRGDRGRASFRVAFAVRALDARRASTREATLEATNRRRASRSRPAPARVSTVRARASSARGLARAEGTQTPERTENLLSEIRSDERVRGSFLSRDWSISAASEGIFEG